MNKYFPIFLNLANKKCVVIGGGKVAYRKVLNLCKAKAKVFVIAPKIIKEIRKNKLVKVFNREFKESDLKDAFLVISATNDPELNEMICELCKKNKILVNLADNHKYSDFISPAVINIGKVVIAISTLGNYPGLASYIKKEIKKQIPANLSQLLPYLVRLRQRILRNVTDTEIRHKILRKAIPPNLLTILRKNNLADVKDIISKRIKYYLQKYSTRQKK